MPTSLVSAMTSNTAPAPYVASASTTYPSYQPFQAFDKSASTYWSTGTGVKAGWLALDLGSAKQADLYRITPNGSLDRAPKTWTLEGSTDGTTWTTLDTRASVIWPSTAMQEFTVATPGSYRHYRLNVTVNNGNSSFLQFAELDLLESATAAVSATLAGTLPQLVAAVSTTHTPPPVDAALAGTLPTMVGTVVGSLPDVPIDATLAGTLPALTGAFSSVETVVVETSSAFANYGYSYSGRGEVTYDPPIAVSPARIRPAIIRRVHQSIPAPTLVDGRPV